MPDAALVLPTLRKAHDAFARVVSPLDGEAVRRRSFCDDWTIAQVASHIGSGAELGMDWLRAAVEHAEPMPGEEMPAVWDKWNARSPEEQVSEAVIADDAYVAAFAARSPEELAEAHINLFGFMELDGVGLAMLRLPELVIHSWDIAVMADPSAALLPDAVEPIIDELAPRAGRMGKPQPGPWSVNVTTTAPARAFVLRNGDAVSLEPGTSPDASGTMRLPAEALIRLVYGRVGRAQPGVVDVEGDGVALSDVLAVFPGF